jgi:CRISPR-associated endoribonuclease Cas6
MPLAVENFIKGLFMNQQLEIADLKSKAIFNIVQIESLPNGTYTNTTVLLQPLSPLVVGRKNERSHYDYRSPQDEDFAECLYYNWIEKCAAAGINAGTLNKEIFIKVKPFPHPPQQRLITIKGGTDAETKIRGYTIFRLKVTAPQEMLELAMGAGLGLYNAQGMGCVGVV